MKSIEETKIALNAIRKALDADIVDVDIEAQKNKMIALTQLIGLSAECNASAKKILLKKELEVLSGIDKELAPSRVMKMINAECNEEAAMLEYADRLNSALIHSIDAIRSVLSLYKTELENSLKQ
jgi:ribosomal protein S13